MSFIDYANGHQKHASAEIQLPTDKKIDVSLFQLKLSGFFKSFDERMLKLKL
tara:strand:- start:14085 stop:14240 length:156 start_codon:yes stop_codon:yes gene_type:complete